MKKLIIILALIFSAISCAQPDSTSSSKPATASSTTTITDESDPGTGETDETGGTERTAVASPEFTPTIILTTPIASHLSDGTEITEFTTGPTIYLGDKTIVNGGELREYDASSDYTVLAYFDEQPAAAIITPIGDIYHCAETDPTTAASLGAQPKWYSEFFKKRRLHGPLVRKSNPLPRYDHS